MGIIAVVNHNLLRPATTMDDVCAIVGWSRAVALTQWFAGMNLYIPAEPGEDHVLLVLLGAAPLQRLIDEFGGASVWIPASLGGQHAGADAMKRDVRRLILRGKGSRAISEELGITQRQAQRIRVELEAVGMLPKILGEKPQEKHP